MSTSNIEDESYVRADLAVSPYSDQSTDVSPRLPWSPSNDVQVDTFDANLKMVKNAALKKEELSRELEEQKNQHDAEYGAKLAKHERDKRWIEKQIKSQRESILKSEAKMRLMDQVEAKCRCHLCTNPACVPGLKENLRSAEALLKEIQGQLKLERESNLSKYGQSSRDFREKAMRREIERVMEYGIC